MAAELLLAHVRRVGRERHVDGDREVGLERERRRPRARERDLLLRHRDRADVGGRVARLRHQPRRLVGDVAAQAVVHRARDHAPVGVLDGLAGDHRDVADAHQRARVVAVLRADVDVQVLELRGLLALLAVEQVDRPLAHDAGDGPVARRDLEPLADEHDRVPAADRGEPQVAVVVDVVDDQPDLVDVADDREHRAVARAAHARDGRADGVLGDVVGERAHASRNTAAGACSYPDGPAAVSRRRRTSGTLTRRPPSADAARTAGCRRAGSSRPPWACRCARGR